MINAKVPRVAAPNSEERLINLEMAIAHLQHELEQMHTVLLAVQTDLGATQEQVSKLARKIVVLQEVEEARDPLDERPPHY